MLSIVYEVMTKNCTKSDEAKIIKKFSKRLEQEKIFIEPLINYVIVATASSDGARRSNIIECAAFAINIPRG